jgi:O-acetylserine/cysteine efflux transporter
MPGQVGRAATGRISTTTMSVPSTKPFSGRDLAAALVVILLWGLNFVAIKVALRDFTPFQLGAARFLLSFVPFALWVGMPAIGVRWLVAYALLQGVGQFALVFFALQVGMTAALSPVVMQMQVFVTALLGALLLGERLGGPLKVGLVIAAAGLGCFATNALGAPGGTDVTAPGILLTLAGASMWAGSNIVVKTLQRQGKRYDPLALVVWSSAVSGVSFVLLAALFDDPAVHWRWTGAPLTGWMAVLFIGLGGNVVAYGLWTGLLNRHPASRVAPFSLGVPIIGLAAGMVLLGERVNAWQWGGIVLVMSALWFVVRPGGRR